MKMKLTLSPQEVREAIVEYLRRKQLQLAKGADLRFVALETHLVQWECDVDVEPIPPPPLDEYYR